MTKRFPSKDDPNWITNHQIWEAYQHFCVAALVAMGTIDQDKAVAILLAGDGVEPVASHLGISYDTVKNVVDSMLDPNWHQLYEKVVFPLEEYWGGPAQETDKEKNYVYLMLDPFTGYHKIGRSTDPIGRVKAINRNIPPEVTEVYLLHFFAVTNATAAENALHELFAKERVQQEWFELSEDDVDTILTIDSWKDGIFSFDLED